MARYYRKKYNHYYGDDNAEDPIGGLILLGLLYLVYKYYTDKTTFLHWTLFVLFIIAIITILILLYTGIKILKRRKIHKIVTEMIKVNADITKMVEEVKKEKIIQTPIIPVQNSIKNQTKIHSKKSKYTQNSPTSQAQALHDALIARGIKCELEKYDGYKHIDLAIPWARMNIEVDGSQHYLDPKQMMADDKRDYYSMCKGFKTFRLPNLIIENRLDEVADTLAQVARNRYYKNKKKY